MNLINSNIINNIKENYFIKNKKIISIFYRKKNSFLKNKKVFEPINVGNFQIKCPCNKPLQVVGAPGIFGLIEAKL